MTVETGFPFDVSNPKIHQAADVRVSDLPAPSAVAASGNFIAFTWIGTNNVPETFMQLTRSIDGGSSFVDNKLKVLSPTWSALTYVQSIDIYGSPTFLGVYQDQTGTSNLFRFPADALDLPTEKNLPLVEPGETLSHLSIAAYHKQKNFAVTGQVVTLEGALKGMFVGTFDADFTPVTGKVLNGLSRPSLYITECKCWFIITSALSSKLTPICC